MMHVKPRNYRTSCDCGMARTALADYCEERFNNATDPRARKFWAIMERKALYL